MPKLSKDFLDKATTSKKQIEHCKIDILQVVLGLQVRLPDKQDKYESKA